MLSATVVSMSCNLLPNVIIRDIFLESTILFSGMQLCGYWPTDRILDGGRMRGKKDVSRCCAMHANFIFQG